MAQTAFASQLDEDTGAPGKHRVIDLVHLARQTLGDRGLEQEILRIFAQSSKSYLRGVTDANSEQELKLSLHSLKGASAGIGANGLAQAARTAEIELRENGSVQAESIADIAFAVEEVGIFIEELLAE